MGLKACCKDPANLVDFDSGMMEFFFGGSLPPDTTCKVCVECGCRHFRMIADPAKFGLVGGQVGR